MRSRKSQKLNLNEAYPCPCRRRGSIQPILLTDAFGCNRCQQIFVVKDEGYCIEQLSTNHYPYQRTWHWTGHQWMVNRPLSTQPYLLLMIIALLTLIVIFMLWTTIQPTASKIATLRLGAMLLILMFLFVVLVSAIRR